MQDVAKELKAYNEITRLRKAEEQAQLVYVREATEKPDPAANEAKRDRELLDLLIKETACSSTP